MELSIANPQSGPGRPACMYAQCVPCLSVVAGMWGWHCYGSHSICYHQGRYEALTNGGSDPGRVCLPVAAGR